MNLQFFGYSKLLANLNKSLADDLNQPTSFSAACSNKRIKIAQLGFYWVLGPKPNETPKTQWVGLF